MWRRVSVQCSGRFTTDQAWYTRERAVALLSVPVCSANSIGSLRPPLVGALSALVGFHCSQGTGGKNQPKLRETSAEIYKQIMPWKNCVSCWSRYELDWTLVPKLSNHKLWNLLHFCSRTQRLILNGAVGFVNLFHGCLRWGGVRQLIVNTAQQRRAMSAAQRQTT